MNVPCIDWSLGPDGICQQVFKKDDVVLSITLTDKSITFNLVKNGELIGSDSGDYEDIIENLISSR